MKGDAVIVYNIAEKLGRYLDEMCPSKIFVIVDTNTKRHCLPEIKDVFYIRRATIIKISSGEKNKNLRSIQLIWQTLIEEKADRNCVIINLGGGVITDLGGFAAATYKRGVRYINIPTTLLAMVDASFGGKTGIDYNGYKNIIGSFYTPVYTFICTTFLKTLHRKELYSGFAEIVKSSLLNNNEAWVEAVLCKIDKEEGDLNSLINSSVELKKRIVKKDPMELGLRKALNLGHTIGHAIEELYLMKSQNITHGFAVAHGLIAELYLSVMKKNFPTLTFQQTVKCLRPLFGYPNISCNDYDTLFELMKHDKKNVNNDINFTLLSDIGDINIDETATKKEIFEALDFLVDG